MTSGDFPEQISAFLSERPGTFSTRNRAYLWSPLWEGSLLGSEHHLSGETPHHQVGGRLVRTREMKKEEELLLFGMTLARVC